MRMDLLDVLITDVVSVTQDLMQVDAIDLAAIQSAATSVENLTRQ